MTTNKFISHKNVGVFGNLTKNRASRSKVCLACYKLLYEPRPTYYPGSFYPPPPPTAISFSLAQEGDKKREILKARLHFLPNGLLAFVKIIIVDFLPACVEIVLKTDQLLLYFLKNHLTIFGN